MHIYIQGGPKVGIQYIVYKLLYTHFWPTLYIYIIMLLYRVQVYIRILVIREKTSQVKVSQEDKADIVNGECHYFPLSKQNMLVISVAPVRCTKKSG